MYVNCLVYDEEKDEYIVDYSTTFREFRKMCRDPKLLNKITSLKTDGITHYVSKHNTDFVSTRVRPIRVIGGTVTRRYTLTEQPVLKQI